MAMPGEEFYLASTSHKNIKMFLYLLRVKNFAALTILFWWKVKIVIFQAMQNYTHKDFRSTFYLHTSQSACFSVIGREVFHSSVCMQYQEQIKSGCCLNINLNLVFHQPLFAEFNV